MERDGRGCESAVLDHGDEIFQLASSIGSPLIPGNTIVGRSIDPSSGRNLGIAGLPTRGPWGTDAQRAL
jgi:hypothetical protein